MSQLTALPRPVARSARSTRATRGASQTPRLRVVETKDAAEHTGAGFVVLCVLLLVGGLISLLLLNTNRAQESFAIEKLQAKSAGLTAQQQKLSSEIDAISAPQQLALQAQGLGLEPATKIRYVRKADGKLLGVAKRSAKDSALTVDTLPSTPASRTAGVAVRAASSGLLVIELEPAEKAKSAPAEKKTEKPSATTKSHTDKAEKPDRATDSGRPDKSGHSSTADSKSTSTKSQNTKSENNSTAR